MVLGLPCILGEKPDHISESSKRSVYDCKLHCSPKKDQERRNVWPHLWVTETINVWLQVTLFNKERSGEEKCLTSSLSRDSSSCFCCSKTTCSWRRFSRALSRSRCIISVSGEGRRSSLSNSSWPEMLTGSRHQGQPTCDAANHIKSLLQFLQAIIMQIQHCTVNMKFKGYKIYIIICNSW